MISWLDLHMHSNISDDGEFPPGKLINCCSNRGVRVAALADHNSANGVEEATYYAAKLGISLISAIELDCTFEDVNLHVLGYGINYKDNLFSIIEENIVRQEQAAALKRIQLVQSLGIFINEDEALSLSSNGVVTGELIAEIAMKDKRNMKHPMMTPYYPSGSRSDNPYVNFYWDICAKTKAAYVPIHYISLEDAIKTIHLAGGIPVLAHPGNNIGEDESFLRKIINQGVVGVEVYSSYHSQNTTNFYVNMAEKYNLIKTSGSDFHGKTKPAIQLGSVSCDNLEYDIYKQLKEKIFDAR